VNLFGYLRGGDYNKGKELYLNGLGFLKNAKIEVSSDPCPLEMFQ